jgi:hypothetical protein
LSALPVTVWPVSDIGLLPLTTPVESPHSNGLAEAFVRTNAGHEKETSND